VTRFDTDKISPHGYLPDYLRLAADLGPAATVCEIGVCNGGSLDMWQALFPHGMVVGVDRDGNSRWPEGTQRVIAAQDDPRLPGMLWEQSPGGYHLIVDDASHIGSLTIATFGLLWPLVRPGGYYVAEDWADPWVEPSWGVANPADRLVDRVHELIGALKDGAVEVRYTWQGLVIIRRGP
jgi:hypothetical protein